MYILKNVFIIFSVTLILLYQQVVTVVRYMLFKKKILITLYVMEHWLG